MVATGIRWESIPRRAHALRGSASNVRDLAEKNGGEELDIDPQLLPELKQ